MTPLEFVLPRRPVSQQTAQPVALRLLYLYDEIAVDVDNILKPILDALIGILLEDDAVITDAEIRRRRRATAFTLNAVSPVLAAGLALGHEFVYVALSDAPAQDVLP